MERTTTAPALPDVTLMNSKVELELQGNWHGTSAFASGPALSENKWHCIEIHLGPITTHTLMECWIDGVKNSTTLTYDLSYATSYDQLLLGDFAHGTVQQRRHVLSGRRGGFQFLHRTTSGRTSAQLAAALTVLLETVGERSPRPSGEGQGEGTHEASPRQPPTEGCSGEGRGRSANRGMAPCPHVSYSSQTANKKRSELGNVSLELPPGIAPVRPLYNSRLGLPARKRGISIPQPPIH